MIRYYKNNREDNTLYSFLLSRKRNTDLVDLTNLANSMLKPFVGISEDDVLPSELLLLKEISFELKERMQCIAKAANKLYSSKLLNCEEITIVDYGCGQGLASLSLLNWLSEKNGNLDNIKQIKLVDKDHEALKRALLHYSVLFPSIDVVAYEQNFLSKDFAVECNSVLTINLFSHVLCSEFELLDHIKDLILKGHNLLMHNIILEEISSKSFPNKLKSYYLNYTLNSIKDYTACETIGEEQFILQKRRSAADNIKLFKYALISRSSISQFSIPKIENGFTSLCPGNPSKKIINSGQTMLWFKRPLENSQYTENLDNHNMISLKDNHISPFFEKQWKKEADSLNPHSIKECAEQFHQGHISHALSCNLPCGQEIVSLYERVAENGITEAYNNLGVLQFYDAINHEGAEEKGIGYFKLAADGGSSLAMINLASYYMSKDKADNALKYYKAAADKGNYIALFNLALIMNFGLLNQGVDLEKAEKLYRQCLKELNKDDGPNGKDYALQNSCCLNLMLLLEAKDEHYLKILDIYLYAQKPSDKLKYCKEILQVIHTRRFSKNIVGTLSLKDKDNEEPFMKYNRAIFLYNGLQLKSFSVNIEKDKDTAIELMQSLAEDETIDWEDRDKYVYSAYARWIYSNRDDLGGQDELYWRKAAQANPDYACAYLTNIATCEKISEEEMISIWKRFAFSDGCKSCHECSNYNTTRRICPKAQFKWASKYETQEDFALNLIQQSAKQQYDKALFHLGYRQAIKENMPSFKGNNKYNILLGLYSKIIHVAPPEEYKPLFPILAKDCYYNYLQSAAESGYSISQNLIPFIAQIRSDKYNFIYWATLFSSKSKDVEIKLSIFDFFKSKSNKCLEKYFKRETICEKQMFVMAEDIAKKTTDTAFICSLGNFFLLGEELNKAREFYSLAKEKGCSGIDEILNNINSRIERIEEEKIKKSYYYQDDYHDVPNYAEDTWDALTDGMYGDYPGGDVDYDIFGF